MPFTIPQLFKERYIPLLEDEGAFLSAMQSYHPKSFRVNTLKASVDQVKSRLLSYGITSMPVPWYSDAFISDSLTISKTLEHALGHIYLQDLTSMLPPLVVKDEVTAASFVFDACAAPGSKTTQLAALMENKKTIIANEVDYGRVSALNFNLEKSGVLNTIITRYDLRQFPSSQFEVILLDAPCSSEGIMRADQKLLRQWSLSSIHQHAVLQKQLIIKAFDLLSENGTLVYSTCTFAPEENEAVLNHLLQERSTAHLQPVPIPHFHYTHGVVSWNNQEFNQEVKKATRIWPHFNNTDGFFLAKVKKNEK